MAEPRRLRRFLPPDEEFPVAGGDPRLGVLIRLLALGESVPAEDASPALAPASLQDLQAAGLVELGSGRVTPRYCVLPRDALLLAGDILGSAEPNVVHAFTDPSLTLARLTPRTPRRSMLDLGTGSGILALLGASHCERVTAVDVNPRALMCAGFNADLNEVQNIELLEGGWFEPVADRRFDLIVGNPPYVISPDHDFTYRDSGLAPGALLEMVCRESALRLEPGGLAIFLSSWSHGSEDDWADAPTAAVSDTGCDALILRQSTVDPLDHAVAWNTPPVRWLEPNSLRDTVARWLAHYRATGAEKISFGAVALRRVASGDPWVSALEAPAAPGRRASEQLVRLLWGQDQSRCLDDSALLATGFSLPSGVKVSQRFQRRAGGFVARPAMASLADGLGVQAAVDPDALEVLFACDGTRTLGEIVGGLAGRRGSDAGELATIAAGAARVLLAHGLLEGRAGTARAR